jgi:hypothetical protein
MGLATAIGSFFAFLASGTAAAKAVGAVLTSALSVGVNAAVQAVFGKRPDQKQGRSGNIRTASMPHHVVLGVVRKGGLMAYVNGSGSPSKNRRLFIAVVVAAHEVQSMDKLFVGGKETDFDVGGSTPGNAIGVLRKYANFEYHLGSPTQTADTTLQELANWTVNHRFQGRAYLRAKLWKSEKRYPSFIPNFTVEMHGANGIHDPRTTLTGYSANPALQVAWILETYLGIPRARIDATALTAAANICDETVTLKDASTATRYESHGFFELEGTPESWIEPITDAMAGALVEHDGSYYIHAGAWIAPAITITDDDILGNLTRATAASNLTRANTIKGLFVSPETYDAPAEYVPVTEAAFLTEDNGKEIILEKDLEFCATHEQARRTASIHLRNQRMDETIEMEVNLHKGLDVKPWDTVTVQSDVMGVNDTYRVIDHALVTEPEGPRAYVRLALKKVASTIFGWDAATQEKELVYVTPSDLPTEGEDTTPKVTTSAIEPSTDAGSVDARVGDVHIQLDGPNRKVGIFRRVEN